MTALPDWLDDLVPLLDPLELPRVITRAQARQRGYSDAMIRHRVESGQWQRMVAGVYLTLSEPRPADHWKAAVLHGGPASVLTGHAALAAHGLSVSVVRRELILVPARARVRTSGRVLVRQTRRMPPPEWSTGVPLAPVARAVADHVRRLDRLDDVRAIVAQAVQRDRTSVEELADELAAAQRNGTALFRQALAEVGAGARSAPEARAATALRKADIGRFEQNAEVRACGQRYLADFLWRALRAILEIDGRDYHLGPRDWAETMRRDTALESAGYSVIHMRPADVADEAQFGARVKLWLASRRQA